MPSRRQETRLGSTMDQVQQSIARRATDDDQLRVLLEERTRREIRSGMLPWCRHRLAPRGQSPARHHELIIGKLEEVVAGTCDRAMILAPPGSAKSTYSTKLFVPYWFCRHPRSNIISASHTASLAARFGREVRNMVDEEQQTLGYALREDSRSVDVWTTDQGGEYIAAGVGAAIVGTRADLVLIDDPFSGAVAANSPAERDRVWEWYTGDIIGRLKPGARIVLICTRWHEDDLAGRLLKASADGTGDHWDVVSFEALCEHPETDPLGRAHGEALWPEWEDAEKLRRKRRTVGSHQWECQYQQNPLPAGGVLFAADRLVVVPSVPSPIVARVRKWDLAATEKMRGNNPDWTVGLDLARLEDGRHIVMDVVRVQRGPWDVERLIVQTAMEDGWDMPVVLPQDTGQAGKSQYANLAAKLSGFRVNRQIEAGQGDKEMRATPVAAQVEAGNLLVLAGPWNRAFLDEMAKFPSGAKDDQVDALAGAFNWLVENGGSQSIIEYYRIMSAGGAGRGPIVDLAQNEYSVLFDSLTEDEGTRCARCLLPVSGNVVSDGPSSWHPECFA